MNKKNIPDTDYYIENGLMVYTKAYHLKRGYCCENQCRHCPYKDVIPKSDLPKDNKK